MGIRRWFGSWGKGSAGAAVATSAENAAEEPATDSLLRSDGLRLRTIGRRLRSSRRLAQGLEERRFVGTEECDSLNPLLLFESFQKHGETGRPDGANEQPLLGIEVITYLRSGRMQHWDSLGGAGAIPEGGYQWLTASSLLVRGEAPDRESAALSGFRVWLNLPAEKMGGEAFYPEPGSNRLPVEERNGVRLKLIAGRTSLGLNGMMLDRATDPTIADLELDQGGFFEEPIEAPRPALVMVHRGEVGFPGVEEGAISVLGAGEAAVLDPGDVVMFTAGAKGAGVVLVHAQPLNEPLARSGPIAVGTRPELLAAIRDYRQNTF